MLLKNVKEFRALKALETSYYIIVINNSQQLKENTITINNLIVQDEILMTKPLHSAVTCAQNLAQTFWN